MKSGAVSEKAKLIDRCGLSNMLNNVVINNFLKNFGYYTQERNRSVVSYGGLIARFVDGFYQVCTPFQGKVVLGETQREKVGEGLIESYRTMLQNHRTDDFRRGRGGLFGGQRMSHPFPLPSPNNCGDENVCTPIIITLIVSGENRNSMIKEPEKHLSVATKLRNHANHAARITIVMST